MKIQKVDIVSLKPMRVASAYGFGTNPEELAWQKLVKWASAKGFFGDFVAHPVFGFNNPYPTPDHPRYGYEIWMKVGPEVEPEGEIRIGEFFGGKYAVTSCRVEGHPERIPEAWQSLATWCKDNKHQPGLQHALERFLSSPDDLSDFVLELYCPIL